MHRKGTAGAPWCAPPPGRFRSLLRIPGPRSAHRLGFVVLAFYFVLCLSSERCPALGEQSRALSAAPLRPAPQRPPGSALWASPLASRTRQAPPGTPTARIAAWPWEVCAVSLGARPHFRASGQQRGQERVRFSEAPGPGAKAGEGVLPSRARGGSVQERCFRSTLGLGSRWEEGFHRHGEIGVGGAKRVFCCRRGVWAGFSGVRETCNGPGTRAPCHLVTSRLPRPLGTRGSGLCLLEWVASSRCGAASPPWVLFPAAAPSWAAKTASVASASLSGTEPRAGGWRPLLPLPNTTWSLFGKEVSREGEGWEDLARNGSVLANQMRPLQGPGVLDCPDYLLRVERCLAGSGALRCQPSPTAPTHSAWPRWDGKCLSPVSQMLCFFSGLPTVLHGA